MLFTNNSLVQGSWTLSWRVRSYVHSQGWWEIHKSCKSSTTRCLGNSTAVQKNPRKNGAQVAWCFSSEAIGKEYWLIFLLAVLLGVNCFIPLDLNPFFPHGKVKWMYIYIMLQHPKGPQGLAFSSNLKPLAKPADISQLWSYDVSYLGFPRKLFRSQPKTCPPSILSFMLHLSTTALPSLAFQRNSSTDEFLQSRLGFGLACLLLCRRCLSCLS